jgi:hypothetical protein
MHSRTHNPFSMLRVRLVYSSPTSYYARRVDVRILSMTARKAREYIPGLAVGFLDMAAYTALPRSVPRIDIADRDTCTPGLVVDLLLKVCKSPRVQDTSLRSASPDPRADTFEILDGNSSSGAFSRSDDLLRNAVIHVTGEAALLDAPLAKQPLRTLGSVPLKFGTESVGSCSQAIEMRAGKVVAVACRRDIDHPRIDSEPARDFLLLYVGNIDRDEKIKPPISKHEVRLTSVMDEKLTLMVSTGEGDSLSSRKRPDVGGLSAPRKDAGIIRDRAERPKASSGLPVELVGVRDLGDATYEDLSREVREGSSRVVVSELVEVELLERLGFPRFSRKPVTSLVSTTDRRGQQLRLFGRRLKLNLHRKFHVLANVSKDYSTLERRAVPPRPEGRGFPAEIR